jgi:hypothetical protein
MAGDGDDVALAATRADVGQRDESGRKGGGGRGDDYRGGGGRREALLSLLRMTTMGGIFPRCWRNADGCVDAAVPSDR